MNDCVTNFTSVVKAFVAPAAADHRSDFIASIKTKQLVLNGGKDRIFFLMNVMKYF